MSEKKKWCKGFEVGRATHREVVKTEERLKRERERRQRLLDIDEKEFLKSLGVYK